jgi:hypothetical protein
MPVPNHVRYFIQFKCNRVFIPNDPFVKSCGLLMYIHESEFWNAKQLLISAGIVGV